MIGDAILREVVGANFLFASAGADLTFAIGGILRLLFALFILEQTRAHDGERFLFVLLLTATILAAHDAAGRNVHHLHRRVGCVHTLTTGTAGAANAQTSIADPPIPQPASQSVRRRAPAATNAAPVAAQISLDALFNASLYIDASLRVPSRG